MPIMLGSPELALYRRAERPLGQRADRTFGSPAEALAFLHGCIVPADLWRLRGALDTDSHPAARMSDADVLDALATELWLGGLHVVRRGGRSASAAAPDAAASTASSAASASSTAAGPSASPQPAARVRGVLRARAAMAVSAPPAAAPRAPAAHASRPLHWIEIAMIGEDDSAIGWEAYEVRLPDGKIVSGRLDGQGRARIEGIATPGQCLVAFPRLDRRAWHKVDAGSGA